MQLGSMIHIVMLIQHHAPELRLASAFEYRQARSFTRHSTQEQRTAAGLMLA